jgi:hypothetical protein
MSKDLSRSLADSGLGVAVQRTDARAAKEQPETIGPQRSNSRRRHAPTRLACSSSLPLKSTRPAIPSEHEFSTFSHISIVLLSAILFTTDLSFSSPSPHISAAYYILIAIYLLIPTRTSLYIRQSSSQPLYHVENASRSIFPAKMTTHASMARVPFAPLDNPRLQHLTSLKNRQNGKNST